MENINISSMARTANGDIYIGTGEDFPLVFLLSRVHLVKLIGLQVMVCTNQQTAVRHSHSLVQRTDPGVLGTSSGVDWAYVYRIATNSSDANLVVAGHNGGLQYSTDGGASWTFCTNTTSGDMDLFQLLK